MHGLFTKSNFDTYQATWGRTSAPVCFKQPDKISGSSIGCSVAELSLDAEATRISASAGNTVFPPHGVVGLPPPDGCSTPTLAVTDFCSFWFCDLSVLNCDSGQA